MIDPNYTDNDEVNWHSFDKELVAYKQRIKDWPNTVPVFMHIPTSNKYKSRQEKVLMPALYATFYALQNDSSLDGLVRYEPLTPGTNISSSCCRPVTDNTTNVQKKTL